MLRDGIPGKNEKIEEEDVVIDSEMEEIPLAL